MKGPALLRLAAAASLLGLAPLRLAVADAPAPQPPCGIMAQGYYAQENVDREWHVRITGDIPSLCGAYILIHDAGGRLIHQGVVPHGSYAASAPFVLTVPKDGIAGEYKIKIIGQQDDLLGLRLPMTDLPFEVYGGTHFAIGQDGRRRVAFRVPPNQRETALAAYKGHLTVKDRAGRTVTDTQTRGTWAGDDRKARFRYCNVVTFAADTNAVYWLEPGCLYVSSDPAIYLTFDPERWFLPDPRLDEIKWWRLGEE